MLHAARAMNADASDIESWKFEIIEVAVSEDARAARKERPFFTWTGKGKLAANAAGKEELGAVSLQIQ